MTIPHEYLTAKCLSAVQGKDNGMTLCVVTTEDNICRMIQISDLMVALMGEQLVAHIGNLMREGMPK